MRCLACNENLTDFESTRKHVDSGEFVDLCNTCYGASEIGSANERIDLEGVDTEKKYATE